MKRRALDDMNCSVARTLDVVGDPWTLLIVRDALFGISRFDDFRRRLDIPRTTLSSRLTTLVDHDVMERRQYEKTPIRHEYILTTKGRALHPIVIAMLRWGDTWSTLREPPITLVDADNGAEIDPIYIDRNTGKPLAELNIEHRQN